MHYVADVKAVDPLVLIQVAQDVLHIRIAHINRHAASKPLVSFFLSNPHLVSSLNMHIALFKRMMFSLQRS